MRSARCFALWVLSRDDRNPFQSAVIAEYRHAATDPTAYRHWKIAHHAQDLNPDEGCCLDVDSFDLRAAFSSHISAI